MHTQHCFVLTSLIGLATLLRVSSATAVAMVPESFSEVARAAKPTVVNIFSTRTVRPQGPTGDPNDPFNEFFRRFFGEMQPQRQQSLGSGFIVSKDGYIVTNAHVVQMADQIRVKLSNREEYDAKLVGVDDKTDVALVKITPHHELPVARLGDSETLEVGDWVVAIGNPFGFAQTVTAGIVSAKGRVIGAGPYDDFIQTDASINPGNSGGPLLNTQGDVVGINSAIISRSGGSVGIGFAIPVNTARRIIDELRQHGRVVRGWLGLSVQDVTPALAQSFGLDHPQGALVVDTDPGGPSRCRRTRTRRRHHRVQRHTHRGEPSAADTGRQHAHRRARRHDGPAERSGEDHHRGDRRATVAALRARAAPAQHARLGSHVD